MHLLRPVFKTGWYAKSWLIFELSSKFGNLKNEQKTILETSVHMYICSYLPSILHIWGHVFYKSVTCLFFFLFLYGICALGSVLILFIYLFLAVLDLRFCVRAFSSCGKRGPLLIVVRGPVTIVASFTAEHRLQTRRLSSCGSRA